MQFVQYYHLLPSHLNDISEYDVLTLFRDGRVLMLPDSLFRQVVQMVDNTTHWINLSPHIAQSVSLTLIPWIVIYPLDRAILLLNNRSQINQCLVDKYTVFIRISAHPNGRKI